jgi:predicted acetyltransferase
MSSVSVRDARRSPSDRRWMEGVYREYLNDLAPQATGVFPALGEFGHREPDQLGSWFADRGAHVLIIAYGQEPVGFALVRASSSAGGSSGGGGGGGGTDAEFTMAEFFVARSWRRRGIGAEGSRLILERFTGRWQISAHGSNAGAVGFWRRVVADYAGGRAQERSANGEVRLRFESGTQRGSSGRRY